MSSVDNFNPTDFPDHFELVGEKIVYKRSGHGGPPKAYPWNDPEEKVRAWFYHELIAKYRYPVERIDLEVEVYRRKPEDFADIVVFSDDALTQPFLVLECKPSSASSGEREQALKQAWGNANNLRSELAALVVDDELFCFDASKFSLAQREKHWINLPERYGAPIRFRFVKGEESKELSPTTLSDLRSRFQRCHDILWEGGKRNPAQAFDEMTKLMFCKLRDETSGTADGEPYSFQIGSNETPSEVALRVKQIYNRSRAVAQTVFRSPLAVGDDLIYRVVEVLEDASLYQTDLDAKGKAFERFLGTVFRGDMGQYFTPRTVVEFVVDMIGPGVEDTVLDPACGSGGFLLYGLERVQKIAAAKFKDPIVRRDYWKEWAYRSLHGIEVNDEISRVAMMGMILHEDGHTNITFADSLEAFDEMQKLNPSLRRGAFSVIMTNPPFGSSVRRTSPKAPHKYLDDYAFGKGRPSARKEILFLERCLDFLSPGGRMGIVLPESILNNPSLEEVRGYIEGRAYLDAVVSLPVATFVSSGANVKSSVLFVRKFSSAESKKVGTARAEAVAAALKAHQDERKALMSGRKNIAAMAAFDRMIEAEAMSKVRSTLDYPVFFAQAASVGITATGASTINDLPAIAEAYRQFRSASPLAFRKP